jgi:crotonobetaine/carnitine-CoA ligase
MNNIRTLFEESVSRSPEEAFFVFKDTEVTYEDFLGTANRIANGLLSLGVRKGDRVAILLPNCLEFPYCWLAANMIGAVMVPVNSRLVDREIKHIINHSDAELLITSDHHLPMILGIREDLPLLDKIVNLEDSEAHETISFSELLENPTDLRPVDIHEEDLAAILYTSGTTGMPKGCMVGHDYYLTLGHIIGKVYQLGSEDRALTAQPFYYMDPQWNTMMVMTYNATLVLAERFSTSTFWNQVRQHNITFFYCIGSMTSFLYNMPPSELDKHHGLRMVMTSGIPPRLHQAWEERFDVPVYEAFGSTETACDIMVALDMDRKVGTACIGRPVYYREARIVDDNDVEVPAGEVGEIVLKRGTGMMKAYYKDPKATEGAFRGGWFHTGDLGYKDRDGDFHFVGRKKDIIRRGGENISAASIEHLLMSHPKIVDAAVIPVPDRIRGEEVKAYIVPTPGEELTYEQIVDFCQQNMAAFKIPRYIELRASLPKTPSERVQKRVLIEEKAALTEGCYDRSANQ